jgi:hypothetical protein
MDFSPLVLWVRAIAGHYSSARPGLPAIFQRPTGGDREIELAMKRPWEEQGDQLAAQDGSKYDSRPVWEYINKTIAVAQRSP